MRTFYQSNSQEEANSDYILKNKAGLRADEPAKIAKLIKKVLKNPKILIELKRNIKKIARPKAVLEVIKFIK
jgi:UDP-N-acetylglucosamine:LPS N-acetylglucosamine transferase